MEMNNGKPLSPWKVPSRISLKRIRHKINSDLSLQSPSSSNEKTINPSKSLVKRHRLLINKFALARSVSTPTSDENIPSTTDNDDDLLARLHHVMPPPPAFVNDQQFHSAMKTFTTESPAQSTVETSEVVSSYPADWSLKSSCRFTSFDRSSTFFSSLMKLRSTDESLALEYICSSTSTENEKALFRSLTSYWTYPHLPWLKLYPRSYQAQLTTNTSAALDEQAQLALQDEWKSAFQSLFQAFRSKYSSFFYLCTHTFNILFRDDPQSQLVAIISPTSSGFRSTLEREGIEFSMADGGDLLNNSSTKPPEEVEDDENVEENDLTCAQWLEDMGLPASTNDHHRRAAVSKKSSAKETLRSTTIVISDLSSLNSLFNFLLNKSQRICISLTGALTGIPPTLLSPRPFLHSTLKYLNVQWQSSTMLTIDGGPLLPDRLQQLWTLFDAKTGRTVQMTCSHLERTSAFNYNGQISRTIKQIHVQGDNGGELRVQFATI